MNKRPAGKTITPGRGSGQSNDPVKIPPEPFRTLLLFILVLVWLLGDW